MNFFRLPRLFHCQRCYNVWISTDVSTCPFCGSKNYRHIPLRYLADVKQEDYLKYGIKKYIKYDKETGVVII